MEEMIKEMLSRQELILANQERIESNQERIEKMLQQLSQDSSKSAKEVMDSREVAQYLGVSPEYIRQLISQHKIPYFKNQSGTRNFFRRADIDNWRASSRIKTDHELRVEVRTQLAAKAARS